MGLIGRKLGIREFHKIFRETRTEAAQPVTIGLMGDRAESERLMEIFGPTAGSVFKYIDSETGADEPVDLLILAASGAKAVNQDIKQRVKDIQMAGVDALAMINALELSEAAMNAKKVEAEIAFNLSPARVMFFGSEMTGRSREEILKKIIELLPDKGIPLAALVPDFRDKVVKNIINGIANENAFIGATAFFPGADMPILTVNQIRMVLKIAAAYGTEMTISRVRELLFVVGGGFAFRAVARQAVGLVPIAGWAVKGAIAYSGTITLGGLASLYFDRFNQD